MNICSRMQHLELVTQANRNFSAKTIVVKNRKLYKFRIQKSQYIISALVYKRVQFHVHTSTHSQIDLGARKITNPIGFVYPHITRLSI